jgi:ribonucleoside-diphosphate reductase alpha chain
MTWSTVGSGESAEGCRMPRRRSGQTTSFTVGGAKFYLTGNTREDGTLGEIFAKFGKEGSTLAGLMDAMSILVSLGLRYGVPLSVMVEKLTNTRFEPMGMTNDAEIPEASSVTDYIFRRLALDHMTPEDRKKLGILTPEEQARANDEDVVPTGLVTTWQS